MTKGRAEVLCGAKLKGGRVGTCSKPAGWGTAHLGTGNCRLHGGASPTHMRGNAVPQLEMLVGFRVPDVKPHDALLMCVRIAAAEVAYYSHMIAELDPDDVMGRPMKEAVASTKDYHTVVDLQLPPELNVWVRARGAALERLAKHSKMAIDAGIEERLVSMAEKVGNRLAATIEAILGQLDLTPAQMRRAPQAIRSQLMLLEGGAA